MRRCKRSCLRAITVTALACLPLAAEAQTTTGTEFGRLADKLKVGDSIVVTTDTGAEVRGRFLSVSPTGIALNVNDVQQQLPASQVSRIQVRRNGVLLGALIGAGAGVPFGLALKAWAHNEGGSEAGALAIPIAMGLGAGITIDAFLVRPRTVFDRVSSPRLSLVPIVSPQLTAVRVALTF